MCGRFALYSDYPKLSQALRLPVQPSDLVPRYNVAPGTWITVVRHPSGDEPLVMDKVWWSYRPHWAKEKAPEPINATVEKVATSNYFRGAFAHHRCLVPADGWFEWVSVSGHKQPHFLCRRDREPIWLAGIWSERPDGKPGCAILTESARCLSAGAAWYAFRLPFLFARASHYRTGYRPVRWGRGGNYPSLAERTICPVLAD